MNRKHSGFFLISHFLDACLLGFPSLITLSHPGTPELWDNNLPAGGCCIVETGNVKQGWAAVDRLSAREESADSGGLWMPVSLVKSDTVEEPGAP